MVEGIFTAIEKLAEPVSKLIETVSRGVGTLYEPTHIRRVARANADAAIITAQTQRELSELDRRTIERLTHVERSRQQNIDAIVQKAVEGIGDSASGESVPDDWIRQFFASCQDISSSEMHNLWGRILAGEVSRPGTFSPKTLEVVKLLRPDDARLFSELTRYVWQIGDHDSLVLLKDTFESETPPLSYGQLGHLDDLGLIRHLGFETVSIGTESESIVARYFDEVYALDLSEALSKRLPVGNALLTVGGRELVSVITREKSVGLAKAVLEHWEYRAGVSHTRIAS